MAAPAQWLQAIAQLSAGQTAVVDGRVLTAVSGGGSAAIQAVLETGVTHTDLAAILTQLKNIPTVSAQGGVAITSPSWVVGTARIIKIDVRNGNSVPIYLQYHDKAQALLIGGDAPVSGDIKVAIAAASSNRSYIYVDNTAIPRNYGANTLVVLSLSENTYAAPSAAQLLLINFNLETIT